MIAPTFPDREEFFDSLGTPDPFGSGVLLVFLLIEEHPGQLVRVRVNQEKGITLCAGEILWIDFNAFQKNPHIFDNGIGVDFPELCELVCNRLGEG